MKHLLIILLTIKVFTISVCAGEGMWIPLLIEKFNLAEMQSKGLQISPEQIYSVNNASIKDAIILFGGRCTGSIISPKGLIITNHHCGYSEIQEHSSVDNNYLQEGFWAMSRAEELPNPDLTATLLIGMEDVTNRILGDIEPDMDENVRSAIILANRNELIDSATSSTHYHASVEPFYQGNQYFLFTYETYRDIRLVGAPPSSIGKFGGDTDNWMWPRHTGDFAYFRIYADSTNLPADYSVSNVPYSPKYFLPISAKGVAPGDFTMVYGYPGSTQRYVTSHEVGHLMHESNPLKISLRDARLEIMDRFMLNNDTVSIQYASKHARVSNAWKKWIGERNGLIRLNAVEVKTEQEEAFRQWADADSSRAKLYAHLLPQFDTLYADYNPLSLHNDLYNEAFRGIELVRFTSQIRHLTNEWNDSLNNDSLTSEVERWVNTLLDRSESFYRDFYQPIDKETFATMGSAFLQLAPDELHPPTLLQMLENSDECWETLTEWIFEQSIFTDSTALVKILREFDAEKYSTVISDPLFRVVAEADSLYYNHIFFPRQRIQQELDPLYREYIKGMMEMHPDSIFFPDANFTLRLAYGTVRGYSPRDGVTYHYNTTLEGVMEKHHTGAADYHIPDRLKHLYHEKKYGQWCTNGNMMVNFVSSNHTSGGNSGSPVVNANGQMVGINFDRVWEGTMSDIMFDPDRCRNISVDARYILFLTEMFAGASHLLEEMVIVVDGG